MTGVRRYGLVAGVAALGLAGAFSAGVAFAADALLEQADGNVEKAIAQLEQAQNPGQNPPFGGHRAKAIMHLKQARKEIEKAQKFADKPDKPNKPPKKDKDHDHDGWGDKDKDKDKNKKK